MRLKFRVAEGKVEKGKVMAGSGCEIIIENGYLRKMGNEEGEVRRLNR